MPKTHKPKKSKPKVAGIPPSPGRRQRPTAGKPPKDRRKPK